MIFTVSQLEFSHRYWAWIIKSFLQHQTWCNFFLSFFSSDVNSCELAGLKKAKFWFGQRLHFREVKLACSGEMQQLHFKKMEAKREETLLLFFFMRPMSLMLEAKISSWKRQLKASAERREMLSNVIYFLSSSLARGRCWNGTHVSLSYYLFPRKRKIWWCIFMVPLLFDDFNPIESCFLMPQLY